MAVFDESGALVESPDLELGKLTEERMDVTHVWVVDVEEKNHLEVAIEHPETGGRTYKLVVDVPEEGHWETRDGSGNVVEHFDGFIPDDLPHEEEHKDVWCFYRYTPYTDEELAEVEAERQRMKVMEVKAKLAETDYVVVKMAEAATCGYSLPDDEAERYAAIIEQRRAWRDEINSLEGGEVSRWMST